MTSSLRNKLSVFVQRRLQVERRGGKRMTPVHRTICIMQASGEEARTTAIIQNLSLKGAGLLSDREYPPGTVLHVLLVNQSHTYSAALDLKITRCFRLSSNQFFLAGPFNRQLSHEEVVPLIM